MVLGSSEMSVIQCFFLSDTEKGECERKGGKDRGEIQLRERVVKRES